MSVKMLPKMFRSSAAKQLDSNLPVKVGSSIYGNNKVCMVVVKEKDARHKENLERHEEPKEECKSRR